MVSDSSPNFTKMHHIYSYITFSEVTVTSLRWG